MSKTMLIEAQSADPYVRQLARNAMRLLNDPSLDRWQRERHIRRLQKLLLEHQAKVNAKASREAQKAERKAGSKSQPSTNQGSTVADASQIKARRKELGGRASPVERKQTAIAVTAPVRKVRLAARPQPVAPNLVQVSSGTAANDLKAASRKLA